MLISAPFTCEKLISIGDGFAYFSRIEASFDQLTSELQTQYRAIESAHESRKRGWLQARNAMLMIAQSLQCETRVPTRFPNAHWSLSHTKDLAVAVYFPQAHGVGVDLEGPRALSAESKRHFVQTEEEPLLDQISLLDLWCIKEAVFKSDLENEGRVLKHYRVTDLKTLDSGVFEGTAILNKRAFHFFKFSSKEYTMTVSHLNK